MFRCLGRLIFLLGIGILAVLGYFRLTPADEFLRARGLLKVRQYAESAEWFETGIERHPNSRMCLDARYQLGECYYKLGRTDQATRTLKEAIEKDRSNPRAPQAQMTLGKCLASAKKDKEAIAEFRRIRERYPEKTQLAAEAEYLIASLYLGNGNLAGAAKHARLVVQEYPTDKFAPRCQLMVGDILSQKQAHDRALDAYQKVVDDYPTSKEAADAQFRIAKIHYSQKSYRESLGALTKALSVAKDAHVVNTKILREIRQFIGLATDMLAKSESEPPAPD